MDVIIYPWKDWSWSALVNLVNGVPAKMMEMGPMNQIFSETSCTIEAIATDFKIIL